MTPASQKLLYVNSAGVGLLHPAVAAAIADGACRLASEDFYDSFYRQQFQEPESTRQAIAELLQVDKACVSLTSSTSQGIALLLNSLALKPGDVVAVARGAFISVEAAIERLRLRIGVERVEVGRPDGLVTPDDLDRLPFNTKVALIDWVNYWSGLRNNIAPLAQACRAKGIPLLLDGVQGFGVAPLDFDLDDIAGLAVGCHKWLRGPEGTGFFYVAPWILPAMTPINSGYRSLLNPSGLEASQIVLSSEARQFEVGTISHLNFSALGVALRMYLEEGYLARVDRIQFTATALIDLLRREPNISLATPVDAGSRAGIVSFQDARFENDEALFMLRRHGIVAGARKGFVRISAGTEVDTEELIRRTRAALAIR